MPKWLNSLAVLVPLVLRVGRKEHQVLQPVVRRVVVDVVYALRPGKRAPDGFRHPQPVKHHVPVLSGHGLERFRAPDVGYRLRGIPALAAEIRDPALPRRVVRPRHSQRATFPAGGGPTRTPLVRVLRPVLAPVVAVALPAAIPRRVLAVRHKNRLAMWARLPRQRVHPPIRM